MAEKSRRGSRTPKSVQTKFKEYRQGYQKITGIKRPQDIQTVIYSLQVFARDSFQERNGRKETKVSRR